MDEVVITEHLPDAQLERLLDFAAGEGIAVTEWRVEKKAAKSNPVARTSLE
ncbi:MAG: hypothetical protein ACUVWX_12985 [Kiritimatiellia bacterium]